ncbi:hypothetical protein Dimus_010394 [Dionaea muscipula]
MLVAQYDTSGVGFDSKGDAAVAVLSRRRPVQKRRQRPSASAITITTSSNSTPGHGGFRAANIGVVVSVAVYMGTAWWLMESVHDLCDTAILPADSPWKCPQDHVFFDASRP